MKTCDYRFKTTNSPGRVFGVVAVATIAALLASPMSAAEVTFERLKNAESEPGNGLTHHKTYDAKRYSTLDQINRSTVKDLRVAFTVQLGGAEPGGDKAHSRQQGTPMAEDGILYATDGWSDVYKIDVRDGKKGRILWKMDPTVDRSTAGIPSNRGVALYPTHVTSLPTNRKLTPPHTETRK